jgi:hypothetical protein
MVKYSQSLKELSPMTMTDGIAKDDIARYVAEHSEDYQL